MGVVCVWLLTYLFLHCGVKKYGLTVCAVSFLQENHEIIHGQVLFKKVETVVFCRAFFVSGPNYNRGFEVSLGDVIVKTNAMDCHEWLAEQRCTVGVVVVWETQCRWVFVRRNSVEEILERVESVNLRRRFFFREYTTVSEYIRGDVAADDGVSYVIQSVHYLPSFMITHISFQGWFPPETMAYCGVTVYLGRKSKDIRDKLFL